MLVYEKQIIPTQDIIDGSYLEEGKVFEVFKSGDTINTEAILNFAENGSDSEFMWNCDGVLAIVNNWSPVLDDEDKYIGITGKLAYVAAEQSPEVYMASLTISDEAVTIEYAKDTGGEPETITPEDNPDLFETFSDFAKSYVRKLYGTMETIPGEEDSELTYVSDGQEIPLSQAMLDAFKITLGDDTHGGIKMVSPIFESEIPVEVYIGSKKIIPPLGVISELRYDGEPISVSYAQVDSEFVFNTGSEWVPTIEITGVDASGVETDVTDSCTFNPASGTPMADIAEIDSAGTFDLVATYGDASVTIPITYDWYVEH